MEGGPFYFSIYVDNNVKVNSSACYHSFMSNKISDYSQLKKGQ